MDNYNRWNFSKLKIYSRINNIYYFFWDSRMHLKRSTEIINQVKRYHSWEQDWLQKTGKEKGSLPFRHGIKMCKRQRNCRLLRHQARENHQNIQWKIKHKKTHRKIFLWVLATGLIVRNKAMVYFYLGKTSKMSHWNTVRETREIKSTTVWSNLQPLQRPSSLFPTEVTRLCAKHRKLSK